jgi:hypothetical protein
MGPINMGAVRAKHSRFVTGHSLMVQRTLEEAGKFADHHVQSFSRFKQRSGADSLKVTSQHKLIRSAKGTVLRIFSNKKHAPFVEYGTKPHVILPRNAKFLRFVVRGGGVVFARKVNHPGTRGFRFLHKAHSAAYRIAGQQLSVGMHRVAAKF